MALPLEKTQDAGPAEADVQPAPDPFLTLAENAPLLVSRHDRQGRYLYVNAAIERSAGMPRERFLGRALRDVVPAAMLEKVEPLFERAFASGEPQELDMRVPTPQGERAYRCRFVPERDGQGRVASVLSVAENVTVHHHATDALARSVDRLTRLHRLAAALSEARTLPEAAEAVVADVGGTLGAAGVAVYALQQDPPGLRLMAHAGTSRENAARYAWVPLALDLPVTRVVREARAVQVESLDALRAGFADVPDLRDVEPGSRWVVLPLMVKGAAVGALSIRYPPGARPAVEDEPFLAAVAHQCAQALDRAALLEREQAARARAEQSEARHRLLAEHSLDMIARLSPEGRFTYVSPSCRAILGYEPEELMGLDGLDLLHPDDAEVARGKQREVLERPGARSLLLRYRRKDGRHVWLESSAKVILDPAGAPVEVVSISRDVTDRVLAEESLRQSEARLRTLIAQSPYSIQTLSPDGRVTSGNPAWERLFGVTLTDIEGYNMLQDPQLEARGLVDLVHRAFAGETVRFPPFPYQPDRGARRGEDLWTQAIMYPVKDAEGRVSQVVLMHEDITERKRAEHELQAARAQLARSETLSALGQLVSGVAHEVRTPLAYLSNNLHILDARLERAAQRGEPASVVLPELRESTRAAMDGVDRIQGLVKDLGRFTRATRAEPVRAPLETVVAGALGLFQATHKAGPVLVADLAPTPPVLAHPAHVQQVVINLLQNASDAIESGGREGAGRIRIRTGPSQDGGALLVVEDDGPGMPPEVAARMYDPLYTTKREGSGLGLAIVRRIVEEHGAAIECRTAPGRGTVFTVRFPPGPATPR